MAERGIAEAVAPPITSPARRPAGAVGAANAP
jgi:hypothetical protein